MNKIIMTAKNILMWCTSVFLFLYALSGFVMKSLIGGLFLMVGAVIINPIFVQSLRKKGIRLKKTVTIIGVLGSFLIGTVITATTSPELVDRVAEESRIEEKFSVDKTVGTNENHDVLGTNEELEEFDVAERTIDLEEQMDNPRQDDENKEIEEIFTPEENIVQEELETKKTEDRSLQEEYSTPTREEIKQHKEDVIASVENSSERPNNSGESSSYNFDTYDSEEQQNTSELYVLNTKSMKIHYPSCKDVKKIKPENYSTSSLSVNSLQSSGYTPCGHCFK